jgi:SAM-dependent methyltransferase
MACLDIGCGTGSVMETLGAAVGPTGTVTGLDVDNALGHKVIARLNTTSTSKFNFIEGDVRTIDQIPSESYDVTFARFLLLHLEDPGIALQKMWAWTKPGGYLAVLDLDYQPHGGSPDCELRQEFTRVACGVLEQMGRDPQIGHKLPSWFERAGIGSPDGIQVTGTLDRLENLADLLCATYQSYLPNALKFGITTEERRDRFFRKLDELLAGDPYYTSGPLVVGLWKQKKAV